jgi:hypothetical protein
MIRESSSPIEFYKILYLEERNCAGDTSAPARLACLYHFLKNRFKITDSPMILQSILEKLFRGSRQVSEFADEFLRKLENLKMAQSQHLLTNSYVLATLKNCLLDKYQSY